MRPWLRRSILSRRWGCTSSSLTGSKAWNSAPSTCSLRWQEWAQTGVVRRLRTRFGWAQRWQARMDAPRTAAQGGFAGAPGVVLDDLPSLQTLGLQTDGKTVQAGSEANAWAELDGFLHGRGRDYPAPIVDDKTAVKAAKDRLYGLRKSGMAQSLGEKLAIGALLLRHLPRQEEHCASKGRAT